MPAHIQSSLLPLVLDYILSYGYTNPGDSLGLSCGFKIHLLLTLHCLTGLSQPSWETGHWASWDMGCSNKSTHVWSTRTHRGFVLPAAAPRGPADSESWKRAGWHVLEKTQKGGKLAKSSWRQYHLGILEYMVCDPHSVSSALWASFSLLTPWGAWTIDRSCLFCSVTV